MAPEQIAPDTEAPIDHRADAYALGVALYEAVTGELPFRAANQQSLYRRILQGTYTWPASGSRIGARRDLEVVIATAMERDVGRRYATALELAEDLRRLRTREPIMARPASTVLRLRRWTQRNPALATFIVLVTVGLGVSLALLAERNAALQQSEITNLVQRGRQAIGADPVQAIEVLRQAHASEPSHETRSPRPWLQRARSVC